MSGFVFSRIQTRACHIGGASMSVGKRCDVGHHFSKVKGPSGCEQKESQTTGLTNSKKDNKKKHKHDFARGGGRGGQRRR